VSEAFHVGLWPFLQALDLRAAAMIIIENGGGYSAAVELKIDMEEPVDCYSKPTPSQVGSLALFVYVSVRHTI
jgi:hypothetical protein